MSRPVMSKETAGNWQPPRELPDLRRVGIVAIDTEENDEGLRAGRGSGWPWHGGWICGISFAWREGGEIRAIYIPIRHPDSINFDPAQVSRWLKDHIAAGVRFVTLNGLSLASVAICKTALARTVA